MLKLFNTLAGEKQEFTPLDSNNVRMYVCGPTVYDRPHIGNARAVVVYDVLFRLLQDIYGKSHVTFVRNITDVDDKINDAAKKNGETIKALTTRITEFFHADIAALNNLPPTHEPRATEYIAQIIELIQKIIANGHAYVAKGHVLFDIENSKVLGDYKYGDLSGKKLEDLIAGARVEVESYKKNPGDFVLWKPADEEDDASSKFKSPWGVGRPGWHIECSAMSTNLLGNDFDIHGGGADLKFPHHENEIAQSCSAHKGSRYARYWVHNGFLTVNGEKMSKSLGNFITVRELLEKGVKGEVIRFVLLATHYRKPLDFNDKSIEDAKKNLDKLYSAKEFALDGIDVKNPSDDFKNFENSLLDDINTPLAISHLLKLAQNVKDKKDASSSAEFNKACDLIGFVQTPYVKWFDAGTKTSSVDTAYIEQKIAERIEAKKNKNFALSDQIRNDLAGQGIILKDTPTGTEWEIK